MTNQGYNDTFLRYGILFSTVITVFRDAKERKIRNHNNKGVKWGRYDDNFAEVLQYSCLNEEKRWSRWLLSTIM